MKRILRGSDEERRGDLGRRGVDRLLEASVERSAQAAEALKRDHRYRTSELPVSRVQVKCAARARPRQRVLKRRLLFDHVTQRGGGEAARRERAGRPCGRLLAVAARDGPGKGGAFHVKEAYNAIMTARQPTPGDAPAPGDAIAAGTGPAPTTAPPAKELPDAARRALAEAEARRAEHEAKLAELRRDAEVGGGKGPEPVRYGDWEHKGIASDF